MYPRAELDMHAVWYHTSNHKSRITFHVFEYKVRIGECKSGD